MKKLLLLTVTGLLFLSCKKELVQDQYNESEKSQLTRGATQILGMASGAIQVSGIGSYATQNECDPANQGATYAIRMTGDLEGCFYVFDWITPLIIFKPYR